MTSFIRGALESQYTKGLQSWTVVSKLTTVQEVGLGYGPLFQLSPHMHARGKNSLSSDIVGLGEATEGVREAVECPVDEAFPS